jgi:hypothetical protein
MKEFMPFLFLGTIALLLYYIYKKRIKIGYFIGKLLFAIGLKSVAYILSKIEDVPKWKIALFISALYVLSKVFTHRN